MIILHKTSNVLELNNILINLFNQERLVGLSLKLKKQDLNVNITPVNMKIERLKNTR